MRWLVFIVLLCVILAGMVPLDCGIIADGAYKLSVRFRITDGTPIRSVACELYGKKEPAEAELEFASPEDFRSVKDGPLTGEVLTVRVPFSVHCMKSLFGWCYSKSDNQFRALSMIVQLENGKEIRKVVTIPHRREARTVVVDIP